MHDLTQPPRCIHHKLRPLVTTVIEGLQSLLMVLKPIFFQTISQHHRILYRLPEGKESIIRLGSEQAGIFFGYCQLMLYCRNNINAGGNSSSITIS